MKASENFLTYLILGAILVLVLGVGIGPQYYSLQKREKRIAQLKEQIEQQRLLHPLYTSLMKKAAFEPPEGLPFPDRKGLARGEVGRLNEMFEEAARQSNFAVESVLPHINAMDKGAGLLQADLTLRGEFTNLRSFLLTLGSMPFMEHLERVRVERTPAWDNIELTLWLALE